MTTHTHRRILTNTHILHTYKRWKSTNWPYAFPKGPSQVTECKSSGGREKQMKEKPNPSLHRRVVVVGKCFSFSFFLYISRFLFSLSFFVWHCNPAGKTGFSMNIKKKKCEENFRSVNAIVVLSLFFRVPFDRTVFHTLPYKTPT